MLSKVLSLGLSGVNGYEVQTECYIGTGLPAFELVGLPDASVKEARERVRSAIKTNGMKFPVSRLTVNLAPADMAVLHPLPRVNEITLDVDDDPRACYFKQVLYGKYMRMALILKLLEVK